MALTKRTHIMLDPAMFQWLKQEASQQRVTVGNLVRSYLEEKLKAQINQIKNNRLKFFADMERLRKLNPVKSRLNYRELIEDGRKY